MRTSLYQQHENYQKIAFWKYIYRENQATGTADRHVSQINEVYPDDEDNNSISNRSSVSPDEPTRSHRDESAVMSQQDVKPTAGRSSRVWNNKVLRIKNVWWRMRLFLIH